MEKQTNDFVPLQFEEKAALYRQRSSVYGDSYKRFGGVMKALYGEVSLATPEEYGRFCNSVQMVGKLVRYINQFKSGGHDDSLDDLAVYAMIQKELDTDARRK